MTDIPSRLTEALAGRYTIEQELGEGGMATVYLARDLKHNRQVAVKVLKPELAAVVGADRFLTEIETTANLQHPHILPLFDSGEADGFLFYVMPYIEGETLKERIDREKQLPVDEAVGIAIAVANALQTAHEQGVIHRDIKPANILLSRGEPLVADFGIALAVGAAGGNRLTETGLSVGTPFYMSPEQATGDQHVGPASDTYALACVLYEMLTGDPPYQGNSAQAVLGKIIQGAPPSATEARGSVPRNVDGAILKALEKLPADRFTSAKEFAQALSNPAFRYGETAADAAGARRLWTPLTSVFAAATLVLGALSVWAWMRSPSDTAVNQFMLDIDEVVSSEANLGTRGRLSLSPDGRRLVFVGPGSGPDPGRQLWLRELDQLDARPIPGTEGGYNPAISPNGEHVAFVTSRGGPRELRRVPLDGGPSLLVSDSLIDPGGVSWGWDGYIYADTHLEDDGFGRVHEDGGLPEAVTRPAEGETWHTAPFALPNGRGVLFYIGGTEQVAVVDVETGEHTPLVDGVWGGYARSGHLIWVTRDGTLMAQPFDQDSFELSGRPTPLAENLLVPPRLGGANVAISHTGELAYLTGSSLLDEATLVWVDRSGEVAEFDAEWVRPFRHLALSPDGAQVAVAIREGEDQHVWVKPTDGGPARKLTFEASNTDPSWLPDGESVGYVSAREGGGGIYSRRADGTGSEVLVVASDDAQDPQWSSDGAWLIYEERGAVMGQPLGTDGLPDGDPVVLVDDTENFEGQATVSPDGRWVAFTSLRGGTPHVYARPFPETDRGNWLITESIAVGPLWSSDGTELVYSEWDLETVSRVPVPAGETFDPGSPQTLFDASSFRIQAGAGGYAITPEGDRFLMIRGRDAAIEEELVFVQNFFRVLRERVGG